MRDGSLSTGALGCTFRYPSFMYSVSTGLLLVIANEGYLILIILTMSASSRHKFDSMDVLLSDDRYHGYLPCILQYQHILI